MANAFDRIERDAKIDHAARMNEFFGNPTRV